MPYYPRIPTRIHRLNTAVKLATPVLLGILTLVSTSLIGCVSSDATGEPAKPAPATTNPAEPDSPQAAYDAAKAATQAKDYRAFAERLTPESQDFMAGGMISQSLFMKEIAARSSGGPEDEQSRKNLEASCKALDDLLAKHGLSQDRLQALQAVTMNPATTPEEGMAAVAKLTTAIKDKPAFLAKIMSTMDSLSSAYAGDLDDAAEVEDDSLFVGTLEEVKVESDRATAQVLFGAAGEEQRAPIGFRKVNKRWLIDLKVTVHKPK